MMISAILLGAGESKRMGTNKLALTLGKRTILERTLENVLRSNVKEVVIVINKSVERMVKHLKKKNVKVVLNPYYKRGMSSSIKYGLRFTAPETSGILIVLGDQPLLKARTLNALIRRFIQSNKGIVLPSFEGQRGHPVIFHKKYLKELLKLKGDTGGKTIIERYPEDVLIVPVRSKEVVRDIDTWEDYINLKKKFKEVKNF